MMTSPSCSTTLQVNYANVYCSSGGTVVATVVVQQAEGFRMWMMGLPAAASFLACVENSPLNACSTFRSSVSDSGRSEPPSYRSAVRDGISVSWGNTRRRARGRHCLLTGLTPPAGAGGWGVRTEETGTNSSALSSHSLCLHPKGLSRE